MRVIKRNGEYENVSFDKVLNRLNYLSDGINIDICEIAQKVCSRIYDGVRTTDLDELAAHICSSLVVVHPDYGKLASKIIISNHHKNTSPSFSETVHILFNNPSGPLVAQELYDVVQQYKEKLNSYIDYQRDYCFDYFGFKTLERSYLLKSKGKIVERPQHMWMRVALGIHKKDIKEALQTYDLMSQKYFTHATPTLFNSGTPRPQNSSCFLLSMRDDSIVGIYDSLKDVAMISKYAGGIGIHMHQIRAKGSIIRGNNGISSGLIPMLRVFNNTARYVDQAGKRPGSIAVYLEPHHADIEQFLDLRKNHGNEEERCRDLFLALWVPDLFMERVRDNTTWSLMCPDQCPGLSDVYGEEFEKLYTSYETQGKYVKQVKAQDLWFKILESQIETGVPYICYKDHANRKSNQQNIGTIKSSNLCVAPETMILTEDGYFPIRDLVDRSIKVWNGSDFSETIVHQTGTQQKLMRVVFSNGMAVRCTPYHKFYLHSEKSFIAPQVVEAHQLQSGDRIMDYSLPVIEKGIRDFSDAYLKAFEKLDYVPLTSSLQTKIGWLEGCVEVIGSVEPHRLKISFIDHEIATHVFYMIQTLGVHPTLHEENSGRHVVSIHPNGVRQLRSHGFTPKNMDLDKISEEGNGDDASSIRVISATDLDERDDTYCFNEPHRHMGVFNGILAGNCTEIFEVSTPEETAVCLTGDTEILTENGIRELQDIQNEKIFSYFESDTELNKKEGVHNATLINNGVKDVYEIKMVGSRPIKATDNHKFLVLSGRNYNIKKNTYEWKCLRDLTTDDRIVVPSNSPLENFKDISILENVDMECLSLGWIIGDGWQNYDQKSGLTVYGVCFGPNEIKARDIVLNELNKIHQSLPTPCNRDQSVKYHRDKRTGVYQWATSKKSFIDYFKDKYDLSPKLGKNKILSKKIKQLEPYQIASILSGYFSADGSVYLNEQRKKFYVCLSSASELLLYDVQSLLRCFGIFSKIVFTEVKSRGRSQGNLTIYNERNLRRFQQYINFMLCDDKKSKLEYGLSLGQFTQEIHERDWCQVRSIIYVGKEQVYDLSIPQTHNFLANGLTTHNCNLAGMCLPTYVENGTFNFEKLHENTKVATKNLNKIIDGNFYPLEEARRSNLKHRPVGIGVSGLADVFMMMRIPFESQEARKLNWDIFETMYHAAVESSMEISKKRHQSIGNNIPLEMMNEYEPPSSSKYPGAYSTFEGSPVSKGVLQFDMWGVQPSNRYDWQTLKDDIMKYGIRNSLLLAPMPTASTAQIMGFNESFEPITSNIFKRKTLSGEFIVVNKYLIKDLIDLGLWDNEMKDLILLHDGSVQNIDSIPQELKELYKTVWEIKQKTLIDLSADRGAFICQSQSLNVFIEDPDFKKLTSMHFYGWTKGLKTGSYYIRTKPKAKTQQFTIDPDFAKKQQIQKKKNTKTIVCTEEVCTMCSA